MAHHCRMPVAAAMALTLAAGLATVQEHGWWPAPARVADFGADTHSPRPWDAEGVHNASHRLARSPMSAAKLRAPADAARDSGRSSALAGPDAAAFGGSGRALWDGNDGHDVDLSSQPLTATGVGLLGPPARLPASRTPQ